MIESFCNLGDHLALYVASVNIPGLHVKGKHRGEGKSWAPKSELIMFKSQESIETMFQEKKLKTSQK
jgi:hypothetical protein